MNRRDLEAKYILEKLAGTLPGKWAWPPEGNMIEFHHVTMKEYANLEFKKKYKVKTRR